MNLSKLIITVALLFFCRAETMAQLGALKAKRDAVANEAKNNDAGNSNGFSLVNKPDEVFADIIFSFKDFVVEDVDNVTKSVIQSEYVKRYEGTVWNFFENDYLYMYRPAGGRSAGSKFTFSVIGNNVTLQLEGGSVVKGQLFQKGNKYRLVTASEESAGKFILLYDGAEKTGRDRYTQAQLDKMAFSYMAANGDFYYTEQKPCYASEATTWTYELRTGNTIYLYNNKHSGFWETNPIEELNFYDLNLENLDINEFKVVYTEWNSAVQLKFKKPYAQKTYNNEVLKADKQTTATILLPVGALQADAANVRLEALAKKLPDHLAKAFNAAKPKRAADLAARLAWENKERSAMEAANKAKMEKMATVMFRHKYGETTIEEFPVSGECKYSSYTFKGSSTKVITFCLGSTVKDKATGRVLFVVTPSMRGTTYNLD